MANYIKENIIILFCVVALVATACNAEKETRAELPNIVLIVADDMGYNDLSSYGNNFIETPNLDRLAQQGIRFTDGYAAAPLCSPSRASLLTGLHPINVNITEHIHGNQPPGPNQKLKTPPVNQQLNLDFQTTAELLKHKNYRTAHIGKWHLGGGKFKPEFQGFDLNIAGAWNGLPNSFFYPFFPLGQKPEIQDDAKEGDYLTDVLTDKALAFIRANKDSAFFLNLNYYSPHVPIEGKEALVEKYRQKRGSDDESILPNIHYAAMIESIDQNVGRIMEQLEALGLAENTLVIFTSDNGGLSVREVPAFAKHTPPTDNGELRAGKGYVYEGGIREPFIVRWPNMIAGGKTDKTPVIAQDLFNTFANIVNADERTSDGTSLLPLFQDKSLNERGLLWHLPHYSPQRGKPATAYRYGDWKLLYFYEDERYELYNLVDDVSESNNLAGIKTGVFEDLKTKMDSTLQALNAKFPEPNPGYVGPSSGR